MIDGSEKRNRQLALELHNSHVCEKRINPGGVYVTPVRLLPQSEFTPVPSHGSIFVYMIPPQNVMPARVTPA